ncbi:MAG: dTDP-4-dehydrorhamnose 3,5-epimerase [Rhodobacteraceae bacterium]|nr:dTDP-4-dehydrorhamnose 3,5-epimerase [Paracoccaceae bacterium]
MKVSQTALPDVLLIEPHRFSDTRGWFTESWNRRDFAKVGIDVEFVQDNHSLSSAPGTLRGLHYQAPPHAQDKLVRCTRGAILDVAVDARVGSSFYGKYVSVELSADNGRLLFVPKGFLHGFLTLQPDTEIQYKCSDYYAPDCDGSVRWDSLGIDWGLQGEPVLSEKDAVAPAFSDWLSSFTWEGAP